MSAFLAVLYSFWPVGFSKTIAYMLQSTEYQVRPYLAWLFRTTDFRQVAKRRQLDSTGPAKLLRLFVMIGVIASYFVFGFFGIKFLWRGDFGLGAVSTVLITLTPFVWAVLVAVPTVLARKIIIEPRQARLIEESRKIFANTKATKIVVAGSYGKTSMKELLGVVLGASLNVAITPANKNVAISHAGFSKSLKGNEDVLVIELGEGEPGDVRKFCETIKPDYAFVTGLAPAHLDKYPSLEEVAKDLLSVRDFVPPSRTYLNSDSARLKPHIFSQEMSYSSEGVGKLKVAKVSITIQGIKFDVIGKDRFSVTSGLLGRHNIGPLLAVVHLAKTLGLSSRQIAEGISNTTPYEHRMQPRVLQGGAWIIDDTYNGTIEGMQAGLNLLKELPASQKWYVTPGLVDQGKENERVHQELGTLIAKCNPDMVVLMKNSVTDFIVSGLSSGNFSGQLKIEENPLDFYTNLDQHLAQGDLVLMQNDWTDNYN